MIYRELIQTGVIFDFYCTVFVILSIYSIFSMHDILCSYFKFDNKHLESRITQEPNLSNIFVSLQCPVQSVCMHSNFQNSVIYFADHSSFPDITIFCVHPLHSGKCIMLRPGHSSIDFRNVPFRVSHLLPDQAQLLGLLSFLKNKYLQSLFSLL